MPESLALLLSVAVFPGGVFALGLGLALKGVDRRLAARLQRRVGPPLMQPVFDLAKLTRKWTMVPEGACRPVFLGAPLAGVVAMLLAAALVPVPGLYEPSPALGDLLVLFYLLAVPAVVLMLAGSASGSPFGAIGFSREMMLMLAYEVPIVLVIVAVGLKTGIGRGEGITLSLTEIVRYQRVHGAFLLDPAMWPALLAFLAFFPANLGIVPFDLAEAETEVLEGPLLEYSGPALGLFKMMSAVKAVVVLGLGICLFFPSGPDGLPGLAIHALKMLALMALGVSVLRVSAGRMRIDQAFGFFLKWPLALAVAGVAAAVLA
ncbi:Carbon monoxide-induced hydrogenase proton translocating subunit CooK [uncultured Alphaproteobacteria bacterium]|uniref:Carbon monoxide-induced hydrogenase proton translocating subunit CooK n=1 Tax=uncultured Alphaproteobacteria bacterium TaxID=91750 RepID=A0A212K3P2_9PROT|nr:Carbon monoxide-induced hydrogenase proton translocating subunit CooK [uncultured Alphaproteobacteria bacterium]